MVGDIVDDKHWLDAQEAERVRHIEWVKAHLIKAQVRIWNSKCKFNDRCELRLTK